MKIRLTPLKAIKSMRSFKGSLEELKKDPLTVDFCIQNQVVARLSPTSLGEGDFDRYFVFLKRMADEILAKEDGIQSWEHFRLLDEVSEVQKVLHEFGVARALFPIEMEIAESNMEAAKSTTSLTVLEMYELCQIEFHYVGTFAAFKRMLSRRYGSFAEFCILKGYDINSTRWENEETAIRVAKKLGSVEEIKRRSKSLFKYLDEKGLIDSIFEDKSA